MSWLSRLFSRHENGKSPFTELRTHYHDGMRIEKEKQAFPKGYHQMKLVPEAAEDILGRWDQYWEDVPEVTCTLVDYDGSEGHFLLLVGTGQNQMTVQDAIFTLVDPEYVRPEPKMDVRVAGNSYEQLVGEIFEADGKKYTMVEISEEE